MILHSRPNNNHINSKWAIGDAVVTKPVTNPLASRLRAMIIAVVAMIAAVTTLAGTMISPLTAAAAQPAAAQATAASITNGMPVVVTELAVKTSNGKKNGEYVNIGEFIELTNMSAQPVHVGDLSLTYNDVDWTPEAFEEAAKNPTDDAKNPVIPSHGSIVLWSNYENASNEATDPRLVTDADFNAYWKDKSGTDPKLVMGRTLFTIGKGSGMANGSARTIVLTDRALGAANTVTYDNGGTVNDQTLTYTYDSDGNATLAKGNTGTPGTVPADQIPGTWPDGVKRTVTLTDISAIPETVKDTDALKLAVKAVASDGQASIGSVRLWAKTPASSDFADTGYDGVRDSAGETWTFTVPAGKLTGFKQVTYKFVATDISGIATSSAERTITLTASSADEYKPAAVPLAITELAVDSPNVGGADGYEFIEVTNLADKPVDFSKDYTIYYNYPDQGDDSDVNWNPTQSGIVIPAGKSVVFWIKNGPNDALTDADFNKQYGLTGDKALAMGVNLFEIASGGMANNSARVLKITTRTKTLVSSAGYPAKLSSSMTGDSHSALFTYTGGDVESKLARTDQAPTPGTVGEHDIMAKPYQFPAGVAAPQVTDATPATFTPEKDLTFSFDAVSTGAAITRATLHYRFAGEKDFTAIDLPKTAGSDTYTATVNKVDLIRKQSVEYYLEVSDGINPLVVTERKTITNTAYDASPVRLNLTDGQYVKGTVPVRAIAGDRDKLAATTLSVDGKAVAKDDTAESLESEPYIAADITQTDIFFFNSFTRKTLISGTPEGDDWKRNVLGVFDDGTYGATQTVSYPVPLDMVAKADGKRTVSLYINSGTKSSATDLIDDKGTVNSENADNYVASNIRLVLPDGRRLKVSKAVAAVSPGTEGTISEKDVTDEVADPESNIKMGDSAGQYEYIRLEFTIDDADMLAREYRWDTAKVKDGAHTVAAKADDGSGDAKAVTVTVDNTKPVITPTIKDGATLRGTLDIDASATDATAGLDGKVSATIADGATDGESGSAEAKPIALPYRPHTASMTPGKHTVTFTATDKAGNTAVRKVTFTTVREQPTIVDQQGTDGTATADPKLSVTVKGQRGDQITVDFKRGEHLAAGDLTIGQGTTRISGLDADATPQSATKDQIKDMGSADGRSASVTGKDGGFPYQSFDVKVPADIASDAGASTTLRWNGSATPGSYVYAFVKNTKTGAWDQAARVRADAKSGKASIEQNVANADHLLAGGEPAGAESAGDKTMRIVIQTEAGYAPGVGGRDTATDPSTTDAAKAEAAADEPSKPIITTADDSKPVSQSDTPRSDYDFTFAWESDTQYYNANYDDDGYYRHQQNIHNWLLDNRDRMNIQYLFHTGDIVDNADIADQWTRADAQYKRLDDAKLPYGVLAGNHDVDHKSEDYTNFSHYFGADRYQSNPWYGGSYENNRGHYDLVSAGGIDFVMIYMGWGIGDEQIDWMNQVLAKYPDRVAILDFHEYLLASGGLGLIPQEIYQKVVVPNKNVKLVLSGHYHSAQKTVSAIDDDGDGKPDRNVVNMLFDYQALEEGGMGYIRLMHVNAGKGTMTVRTYSPSLKRYGSQTVPSSDFKPSDEEFTIDLTQLGIRAATPEASAKTLSTDAVSADLLSSTSIGSAKVELSGDAGETDEAGEAGEATGTASISWPGAPKHGGWYAVATNPYGGSATSGVQYVNASADNGGNGGSSQQPGGDNGQNTGKPNGGGVGPNAGDQHAGKPGKGTVAKTGASVGTAVALAIGLLLAGGVTIMLRRRRA